MHNRFSDLSSQSIATLSPYVLFWSLGEEIDGNLSINDKLPVETSGFMDVAEYAIFYAILLDDKELLEDLCQHGAVLDVRDRFHRNRTPLEVSVEYGRAGIVEALINHGAEVPKDIKVPSSNPCSNPSRFFWTLRERFNDREADYQAVDILLNKKSL